MPGLEEILPLWENNSNKIISHFKITHLLILILKRVFLKELNKLLYNFIWNGKNDQF